MIELLSIDLSNYCSKECSFCYNHSHKEGNTIWKPQEVIQFGLDCINHGIKAISLGGGEPFEYDGIFEVIKALYPQCYLSITSNGLPLEDSNIWEQLLKCKPDKIHLTIHNPNFPKEVQRVMNRIRKIQEIGIKPGLNLLVGADKVEYAQDVYSKMMSLLSPDQIILIPQRYSNTPTPKQLAYVTKGEKFQSPSCLLECRRPTTFASVSWDKKVNSCSYTPEKQKLLSLDYEGLEKALKAIDWQICQ